MRSIRPGVEVETSVETKNNNERQVDPVRKNAMALNKSIIPGKSKLNPIIRHNHLQVCGIVKR
jgi:hypothetical protein